MDHPETTLPMIRPETTSKGTCQRSGPETALPTIRAGDRVADDPNGDRIGNHGTTDQAGDRVATDPNRPQEHGGGNCPRNTVGTELETALPMIRPETTSKGTCQRSGPETALPTIRAGDRVATDQGRRPRCR
jgi:hypothetical protein